MTTPGDGLPTERSGTDAPGDGLRPAQLGSARQVALLVYILQAVGLLGFGITAVAGLIINYVKRDDVAGTLYESHFTWQIRTFWWSLLWCVVGLLTLPAFGIGLLVWGVTWLWALYRVLKGWLQWNDLKPASA